jgi:segregation and condensation protein B
MAKKRKFTEEPETAEADPAETDTAKVDPAEADSAETDSAEVEPAEADPAETDSAEADPAETDSAEANLAEADPAETDSAEVEPAETDSAEVNHAEADSAEVDPAETDSAEVNHAEADSAEVDPAEADSAEANPAEVDPAEVDPAEVDPAEANPAEVDPAEVDPAEVDPAEADSAEVDPAEADSAEVEPENQRVILEAVGINTREVSPRMVSIIESLLFVSDKPLPLATLCRVLGERGTKKTKIALAALQALRADSGAQLVEVAGGYQLRTNPANAGWVRKLNPVRPVRLSRAALETLAIVAYRQPVTRMEIDEIRGVDSGGVLRALLERGLLRILGKKEEPGRPLLYGTSKDFLTFFGLKNLNELPSLREFQELSQEHREALGEDPEAAAQLDLPADLDLPEQAAGGGAADKDALFASLAAASKAQIQEAPEGDPELESALSAAQDAAHQAKRIQKHLQAAGFDDENEQAEDKAKDPQPRATDSAQADVSANEKQKTHPGPQSLEEVAQKRRGAQPPRATDSAAAPTGSGDEDTTPDENRN